MRILREGEGERCQSVQPEPFGDELRMVLDSFEHRSTRERCQTDVLESQDRAFRAKVEDEQVGVRAEKPAFFRVADGASGSRTKDVRFARDYVNALGEPTLAEMINDSRNKERGCRERVQLLRRRGRSAEGVCLDLGRDAPDLVGV